MLQPDLQLRTLRLYGELLCRRESWAHTLTLTAFEGAADTGLAAASSLVGAASLTVDSDTALIKQHYRDGAFDFVVNTLDEALRALKNEIRQGRPIAIGLTASPTAVLAEAAERGLAADLVVTRENQPPQDDAIVLHPAATLLPEGVTPSPALSSWLAARNWSATEVPANLASPSDPIRQRWLQTLPTLQRSARQPNRFAWITPDELVALTPPR